MSDFTEKLCKYWGYTAVGYTEGLTPSTQNEKTKKETFCAFYAKKTLTTDIWYACEVYIFLGCDFKSCGGDVLVYWVKSMDYGEAELRQNSLSLTPLTKTGGSAVQLR